MGGNNGMTDTRLKEWQEFSAIVEKHIVDYTVPQYGDKPNDLVSTWSKQQILQQIEKYLRRHGKNQRENQDSLDLIKMAHYTAMIYFKE